MSQPLEYTKDLNFEFPFREALKTLEDAIEFASQILQIDTTGVEPMYTVLEHENLYLREDVADLQSTQEEVLRNAAVTEEGYFVAPPGNIPLAQDEERFTENTTKPSSESS